MVAVLHPVASPRGGCVRRALGRVRRSSAAAPLLVFAVGILFDGALAWIPAPWYDEAATLSASTRTLPQLAAMLTNVDAVHGVYYALMHVWLSVAGTSPLALRAPSIVATAAAAALLVVLVRRLAPPRTAFVAGLVLLLLPRVTWAATQGRSYALTELLAVALTLVFLLARDAAVGGRVRPLLLWTAYTVLAVVACWTFAYLFLLVLAHGVMAALLPRSRRVSIRAWALSAAVTGATLIPLARAAAGQTQQVGWLKPLDATTPTGVLLQQFFLDDPAFAVVGWLAVVVGVALLVRAARQPARADRSTALLVVSLGWVVVPTAGLLLGTVAVTPLYASRYLTFCAPAVAILIAVALTALPVGAGRPRLLPVAGLVVLLTLTLPTWVQQRSPDADSTAAWSRVAAVVGSHRATEPAGRTDAVLYGSLRTHPDTDLSMIALAYPAAFDDTSDARELQPASERGTLWASTIPLSAAANPVALGHADVVWMITGAGHDDVTAAAAKLADAGYRHDGSWRFDGFRVERYVLGGTVVAGAMS